MLRWVAHRWYDLCYWPAWFLMMFLTSFRVSGRRNLPDAGPVLLMANHQSSLDPPAVGSASRRRLTFLARKTLFGGRFFSALIRWYGAIPIDQSGTGLDGMRGVLDALSRGEAVLIFPEGHRTPDGRLQNLLPGIALLIRKAKVPVVPVGIAGSYQAWPRGRPFPRLAPLLLRDTGTALAVALGEPILPHRFEGLDRGEVLAVLREELARAIARAESIRRGGPSESCEPGPGRG